MRKRVSKQQNVEGKETTEKRKKKKRKEKERKRETERLKKKKDLRRTDKKNLGRKLAT